MNSGSNQWNDPPINLVPKILIFEEQHDSMTQSTSATGVHALVFGASALAGWAIVDKLLSNYPAQATFSQATALVNRPFSLADSIGPIPCPRDRG